MKRILSSVFFILFSQVHSQQVSWEYTIDKKFSIKNQSDYYTINGTYSWILSVRRSRSSNLGKIAGLTIGNYSK